MKAAVFAILLTSALAGNPPASIYGAYQDCDMACRTIQIRRDGTFVYRLDGDLYNDERHVGNWTWLGENRIHAVIPPDTSAPLVVESATAGDTDFVVTVVDPQGALFADVPVTPFYPAQGSPVLTDGRGIAVIPSCAEFEVRTLGYVGRYRPKDTAATRFEVTISADQMARFPLDKTWVISNGKLFTLGDDGTYDVNDGLQKIGRSREKAIFGTTASN